MRKNINWYLCKLDRVSAWTLLATMFIYFITGYGMTKGIIDTKISVQIHNGVLPFIVLVSFTIHTFYAIRLAFKRWKIWDSFGKYLLVILYFIFILGFLYVDIWYKKPIIKTTTKTQTQTDEEEVESNDNKATIPPTNTSSSPTTTTKTLTADTVSQHKTPSDCWIIISGIVYDITNYTHSGPQDHIVCGNDNTTALTSVHGSKYSTYFSSSKVGALGSSY